MKQQQLQLQEFHRSDFIWVGHKTAAQSEWPIVPKDDEIQIDWSEELFEIGLVLLPN